MDKKTVRTKCFSFKELRLSVAHMVLWSLLIIAFFTYLALEIGEKIGRSPLYFLIVLAGYAAIVTVLTLLFTHRFIGPFERLKTELRIIASGEYHRRLCVRNRDDIYIRSFISEVDRLLDNLEEMHLFRKDLYKKISAGLSNIKSLAEKEETSKETLVKEISLFHEKVKILLKDG